MNKQSQLLSPNPLSNRSNGSQSCRKSKAQARICVSAVDFLPFHESKASPEARSEASRQLTKSIFFSPSAQNCFPPLLRSYTRPCNCIYACCVVSSKKKLWEQLPGIINELKSFCRRYKSSGDHSSMQFSNSHNGNSNSNKAKLKLPSCSNKAGVQSSVIERVSLLSTILFSPAVSYFPLKQGILTQPKPKMKKEVVVTSKQRLKSWKVLVRNISQTFPKLLAAARTELMCADDPQPAALLLTLLYNLLQALRRKPLKKAVELCISLGLYRTCASILVSHTSIGGFSAKGDDVNEVHFYYQCRVVEANALITTLVGFFDPKGHVIIRLTGILERLLYGLGVIVDLLDNRLKNFLDQLSRIAEFDKPKDNDDACERLLRVVESAMRSTSFLVSACTHLIMSLFSAASSPNNANELGAGCVGISAKLISILSHSLYREIPKGFTAVLARQSQETFSIYRLPESLTRSENSQPFVPSWVYFWLRGLEVAMFWAVALLQRVCEQCKRRIPCSTAAHKHSALFSMHTTLRTIVQHITKNPHLTRVSEAEAELDADLVSQREQQMCLVRVTLTAMDSLLRLNRKLGLQELAPAGGVTSLIKLVLELPLSGVNQWCQCYLLCCSFYGLSLLPSSSESESPYGVNLRLPRSIASSLPDCFHSKGALHCRPRKTSSSGDNEPCRDLASTTKHSLLPTSKPLGGELAFGQDASFFKKAIGTPNSLSPTKAPSFPETETPLPVDLHPESFSTELNDGFIAPGTEMPLSSALAELPWSFTDAPLPSSNFYPHYANDEPFEPLEVLSDSRRIEILIHHIERLFLLDESRDDGSEDHTNHHRYNVVYNRTQEADAAIEKVAGKADTTVLGSATANRAPNCAQASQSCSSLTFRSDFPSGNLERAILVSEDEYDLVLSWDTATNSFTQWFCFSISGYEAGKTYRFNILNMEKSASLFNEGQRVVMLHRKGLESFPSSTPNSANSPNSWKPTRWRRAGQNFFYFMNPYTRPSRRTVRDKPKQGSLDANSRLRPTNGSADCKAKKPPRRSRCTSLGKAPPRVSITTSDKPPLASPHAVHSNKNRFSSCTSGDTSDASCKTYFTLSFTITMPAEEPNFVYVANCFPYTYGEVVKHLRRLDAAAHYTDNSCSRGTPDAPPKPNNFTIQQLCRTPAGLPVPLVTATVLYSSTERRRYTSDEIRRRPVILLTARVHPGESNASWVMHGIMDMLLMPGDFCAVDDPYWSTSGAQHLRQVVDNLLHHFVFKIIPILNPDGVVMGNHRCSIFGADLNRDYLHPSPKLNPVVYSLKQLLRHMITTEERSIAFYTDFHGHSRAKNFLMYGCTEEAAGCLNKRRKRKKASSAPEESVSPGVALSTVGAVDPQVGEACCSATKRALRKAIAPEKFFPILLSQCSTSFSFPQSSFAAQKSKRTSGRLVIYMQFGIRMSYTMEASMMGGFGGFFRNEDLGSPCSVSAGCCGDAVGSTPPELSTNLQTHYSPDTFMDMGRKFLVALHVLCSLYKKISLTPVVSVLGLDALAESSLVETGIPVDISQLILNALSDLWSVGSGKDSLKAHPPSDAVSPLITFPSLFAAGSYSLSTRAERRSVNCTSNPGSVTIPSRFNSLHGAVVEEVQVGSPIPLIQLQQIMDYLFAGCHYIEDDEEYADSLENDNENNQEYDRTPTSPGSSPLIGSSQPLHGSKRPTDVESRDRVGHTTVRRHPSMETVEPEDMRSEFSEGDTKSENSTMTSKSPSMEMEDSNDEDKDETNHSADYEHDLNDVLDSETYIPTDMYIW